ncbi:MAG: 1-deoxy-D-xylulose-5-phosphate synthase [Armatimonadetes bacterium]|nr:1-deoxy-D-xylulose-5-phosphate synthase [Armatimonadota bacterium]
MGRLLDTIETPMDLKGLSLEEMETLAREIREQIIATIAKSGGHFAPNLGTVELAIILHALFDSPQDKIIWDVGHQAYPHKLLTGRRDQFHTIRQWQGLSGYLRRSESRHDIFGAGHGGTSISAALGLACGRDLRGGPEHIVALIGDGSLTAGMALEALNHAGHLKTNLIVILNDNEHSISPNVGAMGSYLTRLRTDAYYLRAKEDFESLMHRMPLGGAVLEVVEKFKGGLKQWMVPGMLFEELGYTYLGPIDGHSLPALRENLEQAKKLKGPVLVHAITTKGKGYPYAESDAVRYHALSPFDPASGKVIQSSSGGPPAYTNVFVDTLAQLAETDKRIIAITAAMLEGTGLVKFQERFPDRCFDVGMAEQHAVTFAAGLAVAGFRPVAAIYSTFMQRAFDQVLHDVCIQNLPVVLAMDRGGLVGDDGATHHGCFDFSYLRLIPNITLMAPRDENELRRMTLTAINHTVGPIAFRYPRGASVGVPMDEEIIPVEIGKGEVVREGRDIALFAVGSMVYPSLKAAEALAGRGIDAAVIDARFVKPLDEELIARFAREARCLVTVEENGLPGGFGSAVKESLDRQGLWGVPCRAIGLPDRFIEHGTRPQLLEAVGLSPEGIVSQVEAFWRSLTALTFLPHPGERHSV